MRVRHFARPNVISCIIAIVTLSAMSATPAQSPRVLEFLGTQDDGGVSLDNFTFNPVVPIRR